MVSSDTGTIGAIRYEAPWGTLEAALTYEMSIDSAEAIWEGKKENPNQMDYHIASQRVTLFSSSLPRRILHPGQSKSGGFIVVRLCFPVS